MEDLEGKESCYLNEYNVHHFLRNVCSLALAELLAKELKNSKFIKEALTKDRNTLNKTLYEILKNVSSKGKRNASKKHKHAEEKSDGASKTQHLNNLSDNEPILSQLKIWQLMQEPEVNEESIAVTTLRKLDSALILNILTNDVLNFPLLDIERDLNTLKESRNIFIHRDTCSTRNVQKSIWEAVESVHRYLGKDIVNFQQKKKSYFPSPLSSCCPLMKKLQQEIHSNYSQGCHGHTSNGGCHHDITIQPTIKHLSKDCQSYETVENLVKFLKDHRASGSQEPRPILLCGARGAGKSSILHSLEHAFILSEDFLLVVYMDWSESRNRTKESFWKDVYCHLMNFSPSTVQECGQEEVMTVLENYSSKFLFLWDLNLKDTRNRPPYMDRGTWILSYQGVPENSTSYCVLEVAILSEKQVRQVLWSINKNSEEHYNQVLECYRKCEYKGLINTPDMVRIFDTVCLGMTECVPFFRLIQMYINKKITGIEENQVELIKLGQKAFHTIKDNKKYYSEKCLADVQSNIRHPFFQHFPRRGYFFQYQVVEDYLAARYIVENPNIACALWLKQATLFKRVFEIVCVLWCEGGEGIGNNLKYVREYLERIFEISKSKKSGTKKQRKKQVMDVDRSKDDDSRANKMKNIEAMEVDGDESRAEKQKNKQAMEVDNDDKKGMKHENKQAMKDYQNKYDKTQINNQGNEVEKDEDCDIKQNFVRWVFLSRIAKEHQNNQDILQLLAEMLTHKEYWLFKCKLLSETVIDNISLVLRHVHLTQTIIIQLYSGPNVTILIKLWKMLCSHPGIYAKANVRLVIHNTEKNWIMHERQLAMLPSMIVKTQAPLYIIKYVGPLLCSSTPQFLKCFCMSRLEVLDVSVCDLASLREVLEHQQQSLESVVVRLNLKVEQQMIPNDMQVQLSPSLPLTLTVTYFDNLHSLLDTFESPDFLYSLKIYKVYIHENFKLNLTRFTKMKSLYIRFVDTERLPPLFVPTPEPVKEMEVSNEDKKIHMLPLEQWTLKLVMNMHLPACLKRFLMRNLSFCDDSKAPLLYKYWNCLQFQRLILLDTYISLSNFRSSLSTPIEDVREAMEKKCRFEGSSDSSSSVVMKKDRLTKQEREERRKNKPEGKELIITSRVELCKDCSHVCCTCIHPGINNSRDTYQDIVSLAKDIYCSNFLNCSYSGRGIVVRKDTCGDLQVQCPLPFLDDERAQHPEVKQELDQVLEALALAQVICLSHTNLSHRGATYLLYHLKERKKNVGTVEPFRLTILSRYYHDSSITETEVQHSLSTRKIRDEKCLQQFNFNCGCWKRCHIFKKSIQGQIYFNNTELKQVMEGYAHNEGF